MAEFTPTLSSLSAHVTTLEDLASLDPVEMTEGYADGLRGLPEPHNNRTRSYAHGHRNGMIDSGRRAKDEHAAELARVYTEHQRSQYRQAGN